ncbi:uncharacterized protein RJT20DRAFT_97227 [Scheffersomyces xylosifermentans]|uniref:uncharacterized protein n=1 Tax=Scheffersomyces xylosifermentans TaxID=1304137 RepID=UPI00315DBC70
MNEKSQSEEEITNAEGLSEAETVVAESPPRINKGRRLVRKAEFDEVRHNLKRKALYSSEDDDDDDDDDDDFRSTKRPHVGDLGRSGRSSSIQKPYKLKRDAGGRSMLQRSCKKGNLNEVQSYIARGANANEKDFCGFTCLHEAALEGHTEVVRFLIEHGANVNAKADAAGDSETPLIDAAENKHYEVVKLLLDNGADPSIYNIDGFTALTKIQNEHTDEEGYDKIIRLLEEASAKFKLATKVEVAKATSPSPSPSPIVEDPNDNYFGELIKKKGIFKYAAEGSKEVTANYFVSGNSLSAKPDILILAARNGHAELVDIILGLNPTPYNIDNEGGCGVTALLASVGRGHYEVVENLLSKDADPFKKRKQDGLNALEIAQRSIHFDPREIKLIHEYMNKKAPSKLGQMSTAVSTVVSVVPSPVRSAVASSVASANVSEAVSEDGSDADDDEEEDARDINRTKSNEERKRKSGIDKDQLVKRLKKTKSESKIKIQPSSVFKESSPEPLDRIERITTREQSSSPPPDRARNKSVYSTVSPSPTPSTKAQEELKAKNALEAKMWQEKAEAKKRARRDMFLKAEKEKERQRKEDEEKRVIEEKKAAEFKEEERLRLAKEAEAKTKVLKEQRVALMREFTIENYPIGLRTAKFNVTLTADDIRRYAPLYIFNIDGVKYVTDLQIALLTGAKVSSFISTFGPEVKSEATQVDKSKIWRLFYEIIGIDPSNSTVNTQSRVEGHGQFQNLVIHFIRFDDISKFVKLQYPVTYNFVWDQLSKYSTEVLLESLLPFDDQQRNCVVDESSMEIVVDTKSIGKFIPPHLGYRKDIIRTISSNSRPLW